MKGKFLTNIGVVLALIICRLLVHQLIYACAGEIRMGQIRERILLNTARKCTASSTVNSGVGGGWLIIFFLKER